MKKIRANSALVTVGMDNLERFFVLGAWRGKEPTEQLIQRLFAEYNIWRPARVGIEASAMQTLFADSVEYIAKIQQKRVPIHQVYQPVRIDKDFRIRTAIQPVLANGRLFLQEGQTELESELRSFPTGNLKDLVDALASAIALCPAIAADWQEEEEARIQASYGWDRPDAQDVLDDLAVFDSAWEYGDTYPSWRPRNTEPARE